MLHQPYKLSQLWITCLHATTRTCKLYTPFLPTPPPLQNVSFTAEACQLLPNEVATIDFTLTTFCWRLDLTGPNRFGVYYAVNLRHMYMTVDR